MPHLLWAHLRMDLTDISNLNLSRPVQVYSRWMVDIIEVQNAEIRRAVPLAVVEYSLRLDVRPILFLTSVTLFGGRHGGLSRTSRALLLLLLLLLLV